MSATALSDAVLLVRIGSGTFAVDISEISEILRMVELERLPSGTGAVLGAISLRGQVLPVLDIAPALEQGAVAVDPDHYIVVASSSGAPFGFCVHDTIDVIDVQADRRREVLGLGRGGRIVRSLLRCDDGLVPLLSLPAIGSDLG